MNVKRFTARTSREALALVRQALGGDAVVLSTKPADGGVEVLAMAPESLADLEHVSAHLPAERVAPRAAAAVPAGAARAPLSERVERQPAERPAPGRSLNDRVPGLDEGGQDVESDVAQLGMSTLSFQEYVRERVLKRRQAGAPPAGGAEPVIPPMPSLPAQAQAPQAYALREAAMPPVPAAYGRAPQAAPAAPAHAYAAAPAPRMAPVPARQPLQAPASAPVRRAAVRQLDDGPSLAEVPLPPHAAVAVDATAQREQAALVMELRAMKAMVEERFGAMAFMERLQRDPRQALLAQRLMDCGFSPGLTRKLVDSLPAEVHDEMGWAQGVLERNLMTGEAEAPLEEQGGVFALIGSTGVGKTTTTAKLAAAFVAAHGPAHLGLITLDAYRIGAHEQLRAYGRILNVPVHTAHDRASLEDLLELLSAKKMVLIDTAGMAQRDTRTRELLEMLSHPRIQRLLVLDASVQGETLDEVATAWRAIQCKGAVLSKIDEAVKLAPALDAVIRHRLKVVGVANGQRVPEDWHRLSSNALMHRALRGGGAATYRMEAPDVQLVFAQRPPAAEGTARAGAAA
ncbi:flagellar biosynthesis protein FlhF [Ideonella livida]|uniref:Flagellar biosynthesis protein FlhF n=1 Tax=Ideonella livida TaxID=2707176 RepID=A0A7C9TN92_9BURK|nr:flagellar biosynthesis protein FlhF [Ideonella livida]NDY94022.1 flagellar biosynthesis protein FlhF [Ideonella livida]